MRILITDNLAEAGITHLREKGFDVEVNTNLTPEGLAVELKSYDALIIRSKTKVTAATLAHADQLKLIGRAGTGVDNIDVTAATKQGIVVTNTPTANSSSVAELTIGLLLAVLRSIPRADTALKQGNWIKSELKGAEIQDKTVGLIGFGNIAQRVAKRLLSFEAKVIAYDPFPNHQALEELGVKLLSFEDTLGSADILSIHVPLLPQTDKLIGPEQFALMKDGVYFIHASRGGIVDDAALVDALQSGKVAGAGLDVFEKEPLTDSPLQQLSNVVLTPHIGAATKEAQTRAGIEIAQVVSDALAHNVYNNVVNKTVLPS